MQIKLAITIKQAKKKKVKEDYVGSYISIFIY